MPRFSTLLCWFSNVTSLKVTVVCNINGSLPNHVVILYQRFEGHDEQTQKDANELAAILSRKNKCEYKVLVDLSCVAVINDSKIETNE